MTAPTVVERLAGVEQIGPDFEDRYWRQAPVPWMFADGDDAAMAARKLIAVGRARCAILLAGSHKSASLPSALLVEMLQAAVHQPFASTRGGAAEGDMFPYCVAAILTLLDQRDDLDEERMIELEWAYFLLLEDPSTVWPTAMTRRRAVTTKTPSAGTGSIRSGGTTAPVAGASGEEFGIAGAGRRSVVLSHDLVAAHRNADDAWSSPP